jgi:phage/plasmid primase-like uncharacterized protein
MNEINSRQRPCKYLKKLDWLNLSLLVDSTDIEQQKHACNGITNVIERAQAEVQAQQKERDKYKAQAAKAAKQATHLKDRVDEW